MGKYINNMLNQDENYNKVVKVDEIVSPEFNFGKIKNDLTVKGENKFKLEKYSCFFTKQENNNSPVSTSRKVTKGVDLFLGYFKGDEKQNVVPDESGVGYQAMTPCYFTRSRPYNLQKQAE